MYCYQCEQTSGGRACTSFGVCGKDPECAALQDLVMHTVKASCRYLHEARLLDKTSETKLAARLLGPIFTTLTNTNFDPRSLEQALQEVEDCRKQARTLYELACGKAGKRPQTFSGVAMKEIGNSLGDKFAFAEGELSVESRIEADGHDLAGARELLSTGVRGAAGYAWQAARFGRSSPRFEAYMIESFALLTREDHTVDQLLQSALMCGELTLEILGLLDSAHVERFGDPEPTDVRVTPVEGKAILVTGHSLDDLESLLNSTVINVYTHGELLPANAYPKFKTYPHLIGNYGGSWQDQARQFDAFPGPIIATTNCVQKPLSSYARRMFTTGPTGLPGVRKLNGKDWDDVVELALTMQGFTETPPEKRIPIGYGRTALTARTKSIAGLLQKGDLRRVTVIGGCDGAKLGRNQFTDIASMAANNSLVLSFACGKYRFNRNEFGAIDGIPRFVDIGQCNDAYSLIAFARSLATELKTDLGSLPIDYYFSWFEQKSISYLLAMIAAGAKGLTLGPTLPAFMTPKIMAWFEARCGFKPLGAIPSGRIAAMLD